MNTTPQETQQPSEFESADTTTEETSEPASDIGEKTSLQYGDMIVLGTYEQDNDLENGQEPIEWGVIGENETGYLLMSMYALDFKFFHNTEEAITWETSDIRAWLNGEFYENHFTEEEKAKILLTTVDNSEDSEAEFIEDGSDAKKYGYQQSNDTQDYIYLFSDYELRKLAYDRGFDGYFYMCATTYSYAVCKTFGTEVQISDRLNTLTGGCCYLTRSLTSSPEVVGNEIVEKFCEKVQTGVYVINTGNYADVAVYWDDAYAVVPIMWVTKDGSYEKIAVTH